MKLKKLFVLALCVVVAASCMIFAANAASVEKDGLVIDKSVFANQSGTYTVQLEAYLKEVPSDIVLVVDQSSSMGDQYAQEDGYWKYEVAAGRPAFSIGIFFDSTTYYVQDPIKPTIYHELEPYYSGGYNWIYFIKYTYTDSQGLPHTVDAKSQLTYYTRTWVGGDSITKMEAVQTEIGALLANVKVAAQSSGLDHRIALVGFGCGDSYEGKNFGYSNTGLYNAAKFKTYDKLIANDYQSAFKSVLTQEDDITASINALASSDNMASLHEYGLEMASLAYKNQIDTSRNKIVVVITDGAPGWAGYEAEHDTEARAWAAKLFEQDATVYTINMNEKADADGDDTLNTCLKAITSTNCYYAATTFEEFNTAVAAVQSGLLSAGLDLNRNTQIVDYLSDYFTFAGDLNLKIFFADYQGGSSFGDPYRVDEGSETNYITTSGNTLTAKGFDFQGCICKKRGTTYLGKKLIINFDIAPKSGFLGGNGVPTNLDTSAVIHNNSVVAKFAVPAVDVPINYSVIKKQDVVVYRGNSVKVSDLYEIPAVGGIYNDFVNVEFAVNGQTVTVDHDKTLNLSQFSALSSEGCVEYPLTYTVKPTNAGTVANASIKPDVAKVHVLNPNLDGTDVTIWQGNSTTLTATKEWKCTCIENAKSAIDATSGLATLSETPLVFTEKNQTMALTDASPADCKQYTVNYTANDILYSNDFWIHVLTASIEVDDTKIYLSESVTVDDVKDLDSYEWQRDCGCIDAPAMTDAEKLLQKTPEPSFVSVTPNTCGPHTAYLKIGNTVYTNTADTFVIHVLKPTVATKGTTIFLGEVAELNGTVTEWKCKDGETGSNKETIENKIKWAFMKADGDGNATVKSAVDPTDKLTGCTPVVAVGSLSGKEFTQKFTSVPVTVHVILPTIEGTEATIKLGNPAPLQATTSWGNNRCACGDKAKPIVNPGFILSCKFYDGTERVISASYPDNCHTYTAKAVVDGTEYSFVNHDFMIHVQKPTVTGKENTIYQGAVYKLESTVNWSRCAHDTNLTDLQELDPASKTIYKVKGTENVVTEANSDACTSYTVYLQLTNLPNLAPFTGEFVVHVRIPAFELITQDLWADLGTNVTLFTAETDDVDAVKSWSNSWIYSGTCSEGHSTEQPTGAPEIAVTEVAFKDAASAEITVAEIIDADIPVTANKVTYIVNGKSYTAEDGSRLTGNLTAKLHANTFILNVKNTSAQNGIFTLKQGQNSLYKVAIPGNTDTTKISGLYCTLLYNLDETNGNGWSWRYDDAVVTTGITHSNPNVVATSNCGYEATVTVSYGTQTNTKWLSGEAYKINNESTNFTVENVTLAVKKEEEGEENA